MSRNTHFGKECDLSPQEVYLSVAIKVLGANPMGRSKLKLRHLLWKMLLLAPRGSWRRGRLHGWRLRGAKSQLAHGAHQRGLGPWAKAAIEVLIR